MTGSPERLLDPSTPLARVPGGWVMQMVTGPLYVRMDDGRAMSYPVGWSLDDVVAD